MYFFAISTHSSTLESKYKKERTYFTKFVILEQKSWVENVNLQIRNLFLQLALCPLWRPIFLFPDRERSDRVYQRYKKNKTEVPSIDSHTKEHCVSEVWLFFY